ncbi:bifunctional diaminohydroxyphosphoribosylaminopyrimidine deaminase/5-amino-6-(5-phosphoribosylamino)uracil reductase RibD [Parashewanella tropica]|uniref:bifunctional diaminohydroxyphosphoribosylaminopyrimidine deaminase/5-amino-6-(5-phosphoribosylamino)uracil reductase RibD n=1 Tax=Parashewanella tropica TaxID=2547970 RepID=UPI001059BB43|nr:bifunctional diaminohydroxyphosphoribosylaminopyrimidine deaminase/5-amino-6-(5-phosphoribosylamino)uracil reductase RibD [Parashewanella tropica]
MWSTFDRKMMTRALQLAAKGKYTTRPNPNVGCVITQGEHVVGEGFHQRAGEPHAEVHALNQAQGQTQGATAYVTLEPCSHYGRTGPCALALVEAKVARVVIAADDPNPQVSGRGIKLLKDAGIEVESGLYAEQSRSLNLGFMTKMETSRPYVTLKIAASLDGKTALSNGISKWITGTEARQDVQRMRLRHCAVVTGINTVLDDDCSLNVRYEELGSLTHELEQEDIKQPLRVVLDSHCRMPFTAKLLQIDSPVVLISTQEYPQKFKDKLPNHVQCQLMPENNGRVCLDALMDFLAQSCNSIMIEAGATLVGSFVNEQLADELYLYQAPKILGSCGRNMLQLPDYQKMSDLPTFTLLESGQLGQDTRMRFKLN